MLDMHAHILPGVDDGPETIEESMQIIEIAVKEGITDIIATSHAYSPQYDVPKAQVLQKLNQLTQEVKARGLSINLHAGQEIRIHEFVPEMIKTGKALTLADSKYVLIELPSGRIPAFTVKVIQEFLVMGKVPIIAHPERNRAIASKPSLLRGLVNHGALAQVTAGSLAGHFGKNVQKLSLQLVESNLIHAFGSDVHNLKTRPALFEKGLDYLDKHKLHDQVDILLENNARILTNEDFILLEPVEEKSKKWWQFP